MPRARAAFTSTDLDTVAAAFVPRSMHAGEFFQRAGEPAHAPDRPRPVVVEAVKSVVDVPLCIDSSVIEALEAGLAAYEGKALVNSMTGEDDRMDAILPMIKKYDAAINEFKMAIDNAAAPQSSAMLRLAATYTNAKKYDEAAKHYLKAGDLSRFPADKDLYKAEAARVLGIAGKSADARKIWAELAANRESPVINEARVRVGELDAKAASK